MDSPKFFTIRYIANTYIYVGDFDRSFVTSHYNDFLPVSKYVGLYVRFEGGVVPQCNLLFYRNPQSNVLCASINAHATIKKTALDDEVFFVKVVANNY